MRVTFALLLTLGAHLGGASGIRATPIGNFEEGTGHWPWWAIWAKNEIKVMTTTGTALPEGAQKEFLTRLRPCAPCTKWERFGENNDGGYMMCNDHLDESVRGVFSYGVNGFDEWGMSIASRFGAVLHEYDCSNPSVPKPCLGCEVHFHNYCLGSASDETLPANFQTLSTHLRQSNLTGTGRDLVLKLDIESAEWNILAQEPVENLRRFRQIAVEFHGVRPGANWTLLLEAVTKLEEAGFAVAHVHGNNIHGPQQLGEFVVPEFIEVTYVPAPGDGCVPNLPLHLLQDASNVWGWPETQMVFPDMLAAVHT